MFGLLVTEITCIITAYFVDILPGGYWFLLVGFVIEGICGSEYSGYRLSICVSDRDCHKQVRPQEQQLIMRTCQILLSRPRGESTSIHISYVLVV
jgi:hypothetical protein